MEPTALRCEFRENPSGIDVPKPRFSWKFKDSKIRGQVQSAYQILLASSEELLKKDKGDLWDSGKVVSDQSIAVRYAGATLGSENRYWWKVRVYDNSGQPSAWSGAAMLMTGKMQADDWRGKWIGADLAPRETRVSLGFAAEGNRADEEQWVQVDLGKAQRIDRVVLHPMRHNDPAAGGWINGYAFPIRFRIEVSDDAKFAKMEMVADCTTQDYANPGWVAVAFEAQGRTARYVRLTVTKMWARGPGQRFAFTLGELQVFSGANNIAAGSSVDASASVEGYGWSKKQLTDGLALCPLGGGLTQEKPAHKHGAIYLRKNFELSKPAVRAVVSFSGLGFSELAIDGCKVGDYVIGPGFTDYDHRVQYLTFDVSDRFKTAGTKRLDVILADGWYALKKDPWVHKFETKPYVDLPKLIMELTIPVNTTARIFIPTKDIGSITESGKPADKSPAVNFLRMEDKTAVYEIGSGHYEFKTVLELQNPNFRGPNKTPEACGSELVVKDIISVVEYAKQTLARKLKYAEMMASCGGGVPGTNAEVDSQFRTRSASTDVAFQEGRQSRCVPQRDGKIRRGL